MQGFYRLELSSVTLSLLRFQQSSLAPSNNPPSLRFEMSSSLEELHLGAYDLATVACQEIYLSVYLRDIRP